MSKTNYQQGDIVLIPYPYDDLSATKKRPVVIVSKNSLNCDAFIVAKITSVLRGDAESFPLENISLDVPMSRPSEVRINQLFTAHKSLVIKKLSHLETLALGQLSEKIKTNFEVL